MDWNGLFCTDSDRSKPGLQRGRFTFHYAYRLHTGITNLIDSVKNSKRNETVRLPAYGR